MHTSFINLMSVVLFFTSIYAEAQTDSSLTEPNKALSEVHKSLNNLDLEGAAAKLEASTLVRFAESLPKDDELPQNFDKTKRNNLTQASREFLSILPNCSLGEKVTTELILCQKPIAAFTSLTSEELVNLQKACNENQKTQQAIINLPKIMSPQERQGFANVAPLSAYKTTDDLFEVHPKKRECSQPELLNLKTELGEKNAAAGLDAISGYAIKVQVKYIHEQMDFLDRVLQAKDFEYKDHVLARIFNFNSHYQPPYLSYQESQLKKVFGPKVNFEKYIGNLVSRHPCLASAINVIDFAHRNLTFYRGSYILHQLSKMKVKEPIPEDPWELVKPVESDVALNKIQDGWNNRFVLKNNLSYLELWSDGPSSINKQPFLVGKIPWN